jgi:hypothetical protein
MGFLRNDIDMLSCMLECIQVVHVDLHLRNNNLAQFGNSFQTTYLLLNFCANEDESEESGTRVLFPIWKIEEIINNFSKYGMV